MNLKLFTLAVLVGIAHPLLAQRGPTFSNRDLGPAEPVTPELKAKVAPITLDKEMVQNVYAAPGYVTYLEFPKKSEFKRVDIGSEAMLDVKVDTVNKALILSPLVLQGHTNMTVLLDDVPYVFEVFIRTQGEINQRVSYTTKKAMEESLRFGPALKPGLIDTEKYIKLVETYGRVQQPLPDHDKMQYKNIDKVYTWNGSLVYLSDAFAIPNDNILVLRLARRNVGTKAEYLNVKQIQPFVANTVFPATQATQLNPVLYPGQMEKMYIFIQGYNLLVDNDWSVSLPPTAAEVSSAR
jgi:hypothetical protein